MILNVNKIRNSSNKIFGKGYDTAADLLLAFSKVLKLPQPNFVYKKEEAKKKEVTKLITSTITESEKNGKNAVTVATQQSKKQGKQSQNQLSSLMIRCEVMAHIPAPLYRQKLMIEAKRQQQELLLRQQKQWQQENVKSQQTVDSGKNMKNTAMNGTNNKSSSNTATEHSNGMFIPSHVREPTQLVKKGEAYYCFYGKGESDVKSTARNLAALEVIHQLEHLLNVQRGQLQEHLETNADQLLKIATGELHHSIPYNETIPGVSWNNIPTDPSFVLHSKPMKQFQPASRQGNIDFFPQILNNQHALIAAKAITLSSKDRLPTVTVHSNKMALGSIQRYANIQPSGGPLEGVVGTLPGGEMNIGLDVIDAQVISLIHLYNKTTHVQTDIKKKKVKNGAKSNNMKDIYMKMANAMTKEIGSSYGMAKLFVSLPKHQFTELESIINRVPMYTIPQKYLNQSHWNRRRRETRKLNGNHATNHKMLLEERIKTFRKHQASHPLPVDSVEKQIPYDPSVTIVRGGTGSGKTTRYPLMLNLFSPEPCHIVVAQPRRLACQTAARRVAQEQGYTLGKSGNCPIGYAVRFDSIQPSYDCDRTLQFQTPGVLLRQAAEDPLLSDVTHLCIDEIHERNADIDLLLALARQAVRRRLNHKELPPLKLILMSATLDSAHWESYFTRNSDGFATPKLSVAVVNVPDVRRYPIKTIHLCEEDFPLERYHTNDLLRKRAQYDDDFDDDLCRVTAELALRLYRSQMEGSILCFLPGMEEIRRVHRYINYKYRGQILPNVIYLHSSISSADQALAFEPGAKIILSTNIAETSVTIPDCKFVIDSGRERQFSLLGSSALSSGDESEISNSISVVGSQLVSVDISQASAKQRMGRAGRVSAGTCYRLYSRNMYDFEFSEFSTPEMLRTDLSQLILHSISLYHPMSGEHPLSLLAGAPDPPSEATLQRSVRGLISQGLVHISNESGVISAPSSSSEENSKATKTKEHQIRLTPLGRAVNDLPVDPRVGRMLFMGLVLKAIDSALTIAALLSVSKVFAPAVAGQDDTKGVKLCSDIIFQMEEYHKYIYGDRYHPKAATFDQVSRIRRQLERAMNKHIQRSYKGQRTDANATSTDVNWNLHNSRVAAQVALVCSATPHVAHLVHGKEEFATRDVAGTARIHPSSVNHRQGTRAYWYVYNELRQAKSPYLFGTTAVSPLELALFSDADHQVLRDNKKIKTTGPYDHIKEIFGDESWLIHADHWVPVVASIPSQGDAILRLRQMLVFDMLQQVALDPLAFARNDDYSNIIMYVLSALEQQRLPPLAERNKHI